MIHVLRPGLFTTIQDLGRYGYQRFGLSVSGAMDRWALVVGNRLLGNPRPGRPEWKSPIQGPKLPVPTRRLSPRLSPGAEIFPPPQ